MSIKYLEGLVPAFAEPLERLVDLIEAEGLGARLCSGLRTWDEQAALYAKGRTTPGPQVTQSGPGYSWHNWGRAADFFFPESAHPFGDENPWARLGALAEGLGLQWGGRFGESAPGKGDGWDKGHVQLAGRVPLQELRAMYKAGKDSDYIERACLLGIDPAPLRPTLRQGQPHGGYLQGLQDQLVALGYLKPAHCRGDFSPALTDAVKVFQRAHGLKDDGIVGAYTWQALITAKPRVRR